MANGPHVTPRANGLVFIDYRFEQTVMVRLFLLCILPQPSIEAPLFDFKAFVQFCFVSALHFGEFCLVFHMFRSQLRGPSVSRQWSEF
jgi:hypothetical protein